MSTKDSFKDIRLGHFTTTTTATLDAIHLSMTGNADAMALTPIATLLADIDEEARRLAVKSAVADLSQLYFMNSSCLSLLVRWVTSRAAREETSGYKIRFVANPNLKWQKRSLSALIALAPSVVSVE